MIHNPLGTLNQLSALSKRTGTNTRNITKRTGDIGVFQARAEKLRQDTDDRLRMLSVLTKFGTTIEDNFKRQSLLKSGLSEFGMTMPERKGFDKLFGFLDTALFGPDTQKTYQRSQYDPAVSGLGLEMLGAAKRYNPAIFPEVKDMVMQYHATPGAPMSPEVPLISPQTVMESIYGQGGAMDLLDRPLPAPPSTSMFDTVMSRY